MFFRWADTWVHPYGELGGWAEVTRHILLFKCPLLGRKREAFYGNTEESAYAPRRYMIVGADPCVRPW